MDNNQDGGPHGRQMIEGNWKCAECGKEITQLPFEPGENQQDTLKCRDCYLASRPPRSERPMVEGNWKCAECGGEITQLPFEPREDSLDTLKCRDCFRAGRPARGGGDRPMVEGSWTCADCGKEITQLPFQPSGDRPIRCSDCHKKGREQQDNRSW